MHMFTHFGKYLLFIKGMWSVPEQLSMYRRELFHQCIEIGWRSMGIVIIISFFIGAVSTVQTAYQLVSPLIPQAAIAQIVRETVLLEFAPTLVCIVLAGVVGSKITSEIGNMRVSEQIDALEVMGINSKAWLVMPKIIAALLMIPTLIIFSSALGIIGGRIAGEVTGIIPGDVYDMGLLWGFKDFTIVFMLIKAYCFAFLIASVSCFFGYYIEGGALEIGRATTKSVITSCIAIL
ncbi:MAG: ABC transporter permease, partial [Chitinophagaceae bacterium]|nr:ABC transporter permease [Chitinophagaceae bacterium]